MITQIAHYRNAASHRFTMAESMDLLIEKLLKMAGIADDEDASRCQTLILLLVPLHRVLWDKLR